jgi:basic membrane protein A and related proteins
VKVSRTARVGAGVLGALVAALGLAAIATGASTDRNYGAIVTDTAGLNDRSFNFLANKGRLRAQRQLNMKTRAFISKTTADYLQNFAAAAQEAGDGGVVIANGFLLAADMNTAATQFPDVNFAIVDFPWVALADKPKNAAGLTFKSEESGYLVGYLAGLMAKQKGGRQVLSAVGGQKLPSVDNWIAGYRAGALRANPRIRVLIGYSGEFPPSAAPKCKEIALNHIARGAQAVFQVAGGCGLGALDAAKQRRVWGIGVDADQAYLGAHILTSGVKRVDTAVFTAFKQSQAGKFPDGKDFVFNLKNGGQDVGKISPRVPKRFIAQMNALKPLIISGKIKIPSKL